MLAVRFVDDRNGGQERSFARAGLSENIAARGPVIVLAGNRRVSEFDRPRAAGIAR